MLHSEHRARPQYAQMATASTLCVAHYVIAGVMETIANPTLRTLAASIVFASLVWFGALIRYLRVTRPQTGPPPPVPQAPA